MHLWRLSQHRSRPSTLSIFSSCDIISVCLFPPFYICKVVTDNTWLGKCTPVLAFTQTLTSAQPGYLILKMAVSSALDSSVIATRSTTPPSSCVFSPLLVACGLCFLSEQAECMCSVKDNVCRRTQRAGCETQLFFSWMFQIQQVRSCDDRWCQLLTSDTASHVPVP